MVASPPARCSAKKWHPFKSKTTLILKRAAHFWILFASPSMRRWRLQSKTRISMNLNSERATIKMSKEKSEVENQQTLKKRSTKLFYLFSSHTTTFYLTSANFSLSRSASFPWRTAPEKSTIPCNRKYSSSINKLRSSPNQVTTPNH